MSYETECEAYALHGDPQRDAMEYEEAARYDRFDGWGDPGCEDPCDPDGMVDEPCPACHGHDPDCDLCGGTGDIRRGPILNNRPTGT